MRDKLAARSEVNDANEGLVKGEASLNLFIGGRAERPLAARVSNADPGTFTMTVDSVGRSGVRVKRGRKGYTLHLENFNGEISIQTSGNDASDRDGGGGDLEGGDFTSLKQRLNKSITG